MSFPSHYGSSPASSMQRDYAILQASAHFRPALEDGLVSEIVNNGSEQQEGQSQVGDEDDDDDDDDVERGLSASGALESDNMSQLSMPDGVASTSYDPRQYARGGTRVMGGAGAPANLTSPTLSPSFSGGGARRRASRVRRESHAMSTEEQEQYGGMSHIGPIPSAYLLGGHPAATSAAVNAVADQEGEGVTTSSAANADDYFDDDVTPMPRHQSAGWLTPGISQPPLSSSTASVAPHETSPLLQRVDTHNSNYGSHRSGSRRRSSVSSLGSQRQQQRKHSLAHVPALITGDVNNGAAGGGGFSGWDRTAPGLPRQETLDELANEAASQESGFRRELAVLSAYSLPIWGTHVLELSLNVVSVFSLGHLGTTELAAASLSSMTANVTGFSILSGFISALDSVLPAAYSHSPKTVGLWTQRAGVVAAGLLVPISIIWLLSEQILVHLLGQDPEVAALAGLYLRILVIGLPGYACFEVCRRYLQAQGLMHAPTVVLFVASPLNAILNYLLVWGPPSIRLGFKGAPIASVISTWLMAVLCLGQCYVAPRLAWGGWSKRAFSGLSPLINLGLAGTLAICSEWWSWEIVGLVTTRLGTVALAAQSVLLVSSSVTYQLPFALSVAAAVRVGNHLGAGQAKLANIASNMAMVLSLACGAFNSALFLAFRSQWGHWFTEDEAVIKLVYNIMPLLALFQVADGYCGVAGGVLRGTGRQAQGAVANLVGYYLIGIPMGLFLTFGPWQYGLAGLWIGLTVALIFASATMGAGLYFFTDWNYEVHKTMVRMGVDDAGSATPKAGVSSSPSHQATTTVVVEP